MKRLTLGRGSRFDGAFAAHPIYASHSIEAHLALVNGEGQVRWFPLEHLG